MKKKVLALALAALTLTGLSATAQQNTDNGARTKETAKERKADQKGERKHINPFEGLSLTEAQQASIEQLNTKQREARKAQVEAKKENRRKMQGELRNERKVAKKAYLDEVKAILSPEQYVAFLENSFVNAGARKGKKESMQAARGDKNKGQRDGRRNGKQGQRRGDKKQQDGKKS